jgi:histidine triad (HIT) family protein
MAEECLFCKIWAHELPAKEVYRDDEVMAFEDIRPVAPVHVLVIPKEHIRTIKDVKPEHAHLLFRMIDLANQVARDRQVSRDGYRLVINQGPQAGQSVYHLHLHVLGGRSMGWPPG